MTRPLFSVGEEVILVSLSHPEFNGEYLIERVLENGESYKSRNDGKSFWSNGILYLLDEIFPDNVKGGEFAVGEKSLRKKYPPSEFTFDELMNNLKLETVE